MGFKLFTPPIFIYGLISIFFLAHHCPVRSTSEGIANAIFWRRLKRQALPVEHLHIHSIQSNITIDNQNIKVISSESIIALQKEPYNATLFSRHSTTNFDSNGTYVRIDAQVIDFALLFQRMVFRGMANNGDIEMHVENQAGSSSVLRLRLVDNVQFGLTDEQSMFRLLSSDAKQVSLIAAADQKQLPRQLQLGYDNASHVFRIQFTEDRSRIAVDIFGSTLHINYGSIFVQINNNYRHLIILTAGHRLEFDTLGSTFQLNLGEHEMTMVYPHDHVLVRASNNVKNVTVDVNTLSKMDIRNTEGLQVILPGSNFTNDSVDNLEVVSASVRISLHTSNDSLIQATTNQSRLTLNSSSSQILLASMSHQIEIVGSKPFLVDTTENIVLAIKSTTGQHMQIPSITVPIIDYNRYNLQNLTQLDLLSSNITWLTSRINVADLIDKDIIPIRNFSSVLGVQQEDNSYLDTTAPPVVINTSRPANEPAFMSTLFPEFATFAPLTFTLNSGVTPLTSLNNKSDVVLTPSSFDLVTPALPTVDQEVSMSSKNQDTSTLSTAISEQSTTTELNAEFKLTSTEPIDQLTSTQPDSTDSQAPTLEPSTSSTPDLQTPDSTTNQPAFESTTEMFPTPAPLETVLAGTRFPIPPLNVPMSKDDFGPAMAMASNADNNFVFGQFETQPPDSFPLEAKIVNISMSATSPMPSRRV